MKKIVLVMSLLASALCLTGCLEELDVAEVQQSTHPYDESRHIGDAFDSTCKKLEGTPSWEGFTSEEKQTVVQFTCHKDQAIKYGVQFVKNVRTDQYELTYVEINNEAQSIDNLTFGFLYGNCTEEQLKELRMADAFLGLLQLAN